MANANGKNNKPHYDEKLAREIRRKLPSKGDQTLFNNLLNNENAAVTNECLQQMQYVVDYLYDNQISYHISQSTSAGYLQLRADTDSPKAKITLTGRNTATENHIPWIGTATKSNQRYAFSTTEYNSDGSRNIDGSTLMPNKEDIDVLLSTLLKNDMSHFAAPDGNHMVGNIRNSRKKNTYYLADSLRKAYKTIPPTPENPVGKDVELRISRLTNSGYDNRSRSFGFNANIIANAINDSRDYLSETILKASPLLDGSIQIKNNGTNMRPSDYGIDNDDIADMIIDLQKMCEDADSEYGIELAEATNKNDAVKDIVNDYISSHVLGLSKDENGNFLDMSELLSKDARSISPSDLPADFMDKFTLDPISVCEWTSLSENEVNVATIQKMSQAIRAVGVKTENIVGDDNRNANIADSLINFDESTAKSKDDFEEGSFQYQILAHTEKQLKDLGIDATCRYDDNGLIDISGTATGIRNNTERTINVHSVIGQIFAPDEHGTVHVKRNKNDDFIFVPGYRAAIEPDDGSNKNLMERTVLTGYLQSACSYINDSLSSLTNSVITGLNRTTPIDAEVLIPTSCNSVYGEIYGTRFPADHMERAIESGFDEDDVYALYDTVSRKIAYSSEVDKDATTIVSIGGEAQKTRMLEIAGQNVREMGEECLGYCYSNVTNTGRGSGTRRYLCETAVVTPDGHIQQGDVNDITAPLYRRPMFDGVDKNALDRNVMAFSQMLTAQGIAKDAKGAHMTIGGWTLDDGYLISEEFANAHMVPDANSGELRPLKIGDKISDMNGNKGVINFVVDRGMSDETATAKGIYDVVKVFKENSDIDFIGAPYSGMSRSNAGTAASMINDSSELKLPNGEVVKGGIGALPILITGMTVDTKSHIYEEDDDHQRNASGQLSWMLSSKKLDAIAREIYGDNDIGVNEFRAYLNIIGLTMDDSGNIIKGFGTSSDSLNQAVLIDDMSEMASSNKSNLMKVKKFDDSLYEIDTKKNILHIKNSEKKWNAVAKDFSGFLELPFSVSGADGNPLTMNVTAEDGSVSEINVMPVVSAAYRSDIRHDNGETYSHDYTRNYSLIIKHAGDYMVATNQFADLMAEEAKKHPDIVKNAGFDVNTFKNEIVDYSTRKELHLEKKSNNGTYRHEVWEVLNKLYKTMPLDKRTLCSNLLAKQNSAKCAGQSEYDNIRNDTVSKKFEDKKHGAFTTSIVKNQTKHSATAVWTADPRLETNQVAMPQFMYDTLKVKDGKVLVWRDPLLNNRGIRYLDVVINNDLTGIAVNPMIDKGFDGDFDGDSLAVVALETEEAQKEANEKLSIKANVLNYGIGDEGHHPLALQDGMDVKAALHANPDLKKEWDDVEKLANEEVSKYGIVSDDTYNRFNKLAKAVLVESSYENVMDYDSPEAVAESLIKMSKEFGNGAKGSIGKLKGYMEYLGYDVDVDDKGNVSVKEMPMSKETRFEKNRNVCIALGCKCDETGVAGYASQKAIRALRNICPTEALELTYPVTQGMLQAKHDADEAKLKADLTQNVIPDLWEGKKLEMDSDGNWSPVVTSNKGQSTSKMATVDEWKDQFMRIMCQANGVGIDDGDNVREKFATIMNPVALDIVADVLGKYGNNGKVAGISDIASQTASLSDVLMYGVPQNTGSYNEDTTITTALFNAAEANDGKGTNLFKNGCELFATNAIRKANGWAVSAITNNFDTPPVAPMVMDDIEKSNLSLSMA